MIVPGRAAGRRITVLADRPQESLLKIPAIAASIVAARGAANPATAQAPPPAPERKPLSVPR
jgi:hypothetical protein